MKLKPNIVPGTKYQFDLEDLAVVGMNDQGITLSYKQGLQVQIDISGFADRERQYGEVCAAQLRGYFKHQEGGSHDNV